MLLFIQDSVEDGFNSLRPLFCTCYYGNAVSILITIFPEVAVISTFNDDFLIIGREIFKAFIVFLSVENAIFSTIYDYDLFPLSLMSLSAYEAIITSPWNPSRLLPRHIAAIDPPNE